jgi:hypothetical protein
MQSSFSQARRQERQQLETQSGVNWWKAMGLIPGPQTPIGQPLIGSEARRNRKRFEDEARTLAMDSVWYEVSEVGELDSRFKAMAGQQARGLIVLGSPFTFANARLLVELARQVPHSGHV